MTTEYVSEQKVRLDEFYTYWKERNKSEPDQFPMVLTPRDWDEQFAAWEEHKGYK